VQTPGKRFVPIVPVIVLAANVIGVPAPWPGSVPTKYSPAATPETPSDAVAVTVVDWPTDFGLMLKAGVPTVSPP
jgi:hypothetical protein